MFKNIETKSRNHFPISVLDSLEDEFEQNTDGEFATGIRVAFIMWDKNSPHSYAVVYYQNGHQYAIKEFNIFDRPLTPPQPEKRAA
jgi:hypothetical protein